jgi:hypothetical protein
MLPVELPFDLKTPTKVVEKDKVDVAAKPETQVDVIMTVVEPEKERK